MKKHSTSLVVAKRNHPTPTDTTLTAKEQTEFGRLEKQIQDNYQRAFELAAALAQIRDSKLYRAEYNTFEEYCKKRWEYSRSYCERLCDMNSVVIDLEGLKDNKVIPENEAQARVYVSLDKEERIQLAEKVIEEEIEDITASLLTSYKKELFPKKCTSESKKKKPGPVLEAEVTIPEPPSVVKVVEAAEEALQGLVDDECDDGPFAEAVRAFIKEAKPYLEWEKQRKENN